MFKQKIIEDHKTFLSIDIWSRFIRAVVCVFRKWKLNILAEEQILQNKSDFTNWKIINVIWITNTIALLLEKILDNFWEIPNDVIVWFNTDLHLYDIVKIKYKRTDPYAVITNSELDSIIYSREAKSLKKIEQDKALSMWIVDVDVKLVSSIITSIKIDSENVSNPIWFTGHYVELNIMNTFLPMSIYSNISNVIKRLNLNPFAILPIVLVYPKLIEENSDFSDSNNVFIDLWTDHVSLSVVKNNETVWFQTCNMWLSNLQKELIKEFNLTPIEAEHAIIDYKIEYRRTIDKYIILLINVIKVALSDIDPNLKINNIFYLSDKNTLLDIFLEKALLKDDYFSNSRFRSKIDLKDFNFYSDNNDNKNTNYWILALSLMIRDVIPERRSNIVNLIRNLFSRYIG